MTPHDERILAPKIHAADDAECLAEFARAHWFCQACGAASDNLTVAHILGGHAGRADEPCNLLMLCWIPCHVAYDGQYIALRRHNVPRLTLGMMLSMKVRAGELDEAGLARLAILHGRTLPDAADIPEFFVKLFRRNRPELFSGR